MRSRFLFAPAIVLSSSLFLSVLHAEGVEDAAKVSLASFPGLKTLVISGGEGALAQQLSYDASLTQVLNKPLNPGAKDEPEITRLASVQLNRDSEVRHFIDFDPGPSADPVYTITDEKTGRKVGEIAADVLVTPGNGFIYAVGRTDKMHTERRKYAVKEGKLIEIEQPFSYVGLDTKANVALKLTAKKGGGETIADIPKGSEVQVVLRDGDYLLLKSSFGLVGWWKMRKDVQAADAEIEGIYYAGD